MAAPIGHSLFGLLIYSILCYNQPSPEHWTKIAALIVLFSNLPDLDVFPGIIYNDVNYFHRGFMHSFLFAIIVPLILAPYLPISPVVCASLIASHVVLDMYCDGINTVSHIWPLYTFESGYSISIMEGIRTIFKEIL